MIQPNRGRARIGVLVPFTNVNLEPDMALLCPQGVSLHFSRLGGYDQDEIPDDTQMAGLGASDMSEELRLLQGAKPDLIMYGCTSATLTHGADFDRDLAERIKTQSGAKTVTAAGALVHAIRSLNVTKVAFASPYVGAINDQAEAFLASEGITIVHRADIGKVLDNYGQGELSPDEVFNLATRANVSEAQAIVLSCTDMRSVEVVDRVETATDKPVICSNQAMMFHAAQMLGLDAPVVGRLQEAA